MFRLIILTVVMLTLLVGNVLGQDAENVELVGRIYNQWNKAYNVVIRDDLAYVAASYSGIQILDVSDPENLHVIGYWDGNPGVAFSIAVSGDFKVNE